MSQLFQNEEREKEEILQMEAIRHEQRLNLKALVFTLAVVMAPFVALLIDFRLALIALSAGLALTVWLTLKAAQEAGVLLRSRLRVIAVMNAVILVVVLGILVFSIV